MLMVSIDNQTCLSLGWKGHGAGVEEDWQHPVAQERVRRYVLQSTKSLVPAIPSPPRVTALSWQAVGFGDHGRLSGLKFSFSSAAATVLAAGLHSGISQGTTAEEETLVWLMAAPTPWCDQRTLTRWVKFLFMSPLLLNKQVKMERKREHPASLEKFILVFIFMLCAYHLGLWDSWVILSPNNKKMKLVVELFTNRRCGEGGVHTPKGLKGETNPKKGANTEKLPKCR